MQILSTRLKRDLDEGKPIRLELGSGGPAREGFYALDRLPLDGVDAVADLNEPLEALPDDCASVVRSRNVLEHVENLELALRERLQIEFYRLTRFDRLVEPLMERLVNRSARTPDLYERRLSQFFHAWQIRRVLRPDE